MPKLESPKKPRSSRTVIRFDLYDELTEAELESFERNAAEAGAPSLTEHFLNTSVRPRLAYLQEVFSPQS